MKHSNDPSHHESKRLTCTWSHLIFDEKCRWLRRHFFLLVCFLLFLCVCVCQKKVNSLTNGFNICWDWIDVYVKCTICSLYIDVMYCHFNASPIIFQLKTLILSMANWIFELLGLYLIELDCLLNLSIFWLISETQSSTRDKKRQRDRF